MYNKKLNQSWAFLFRSSLGCTVLLCTFMTFIKQVLNWHLSHSRCFPLVCSNSDLWSIDLKSHSSHTNILFSSAFVVWFGFDFSKWTFLLCLLRFVLYLVTKLQSSQLNRLISPSWCTFLSWKLSVSFLFVTKSQWVHSYCTSPCTDWMWRVNVFFWMLLKLHLTVIFWKECWCVDGILMVI